MGHVATFLLAVTSLCSWTFSTSSTTCERPSATPQLWRENNVDEHLRTYPDGSQLSFEDYVKNLQVDHFTCGIGKESRLTEAMRCNTLISDADWLVLRSVQSWNHYANVMFYEIQKTDKQTLKDIVSSTLRMLLTTDHQPSRHRKRALEVKGAKNLSPVVSEKNSQVNIELRPDVMDLTIQKPLVEHLVPEARDIRLDKLPPLWVRTLRYAREAIDRGLSALRQGPARRFNSYYPAPFGPGGKPLLPARFQTPELREIESKKAQRAREWEQYYDLLKNPRQPIDKETKEQYEMKLQDAIREWHLEHIKASKHINTRLKQKSQESLDAYKEKLNLVLKLKHRRDQLESLVQPQDSPMELATTKSLDKEMQDALNYLTAAYQTTEKSLAKLSADKQISPIAENPRLPKWKFTVPRLPKARKTREDAGAIQPPPPPPFFKLRDLYTKRSAQVAYKIKRIGERWRILYESEVTPNDPELAAQRNSEIRQLQSTWHELNQKYVSLRKAESMQAVIDEGATNEELKQKQLLAQTRGILAQLEQIAKDVEQMRLLHGNRADEHFKTAAQPILSKIFSHPTSQGKPSTATSSKKKLNKRSVDSTRETKGQPQPHSTSIPSADEFIGQHGPALLLRLTSLIESNVRLTLSNPISRDLLSSIKGGMFLQKIQSSTILDDENFLLELGVLSQILNEMNVTISYDGRTCDLASESLTISQSGQAASSCGPNGVLRTISSQSTVEGGIKLMENLNNLAKSRGYQLSTLIDLALVCDARIDSKTSRSSSELPSTTHPFSDGISLCIFKLPVHRPTV